MSVTTPRYEVRRCGDSWGIYDQETGRYLMCSTDKSRVQGWVNQLNDAAAAGRLEREGNDDR